MNESKSLLRDTSGRWAAAAVRVSSSNTALTNPPAKRDHETRHSSSYRREDEVHYVVPHEDTPLLQRFPPQVVQRNTATTTVTVASLLTILILGVVIGIYLLIIQNNSENVLPPVDTPLQLVSRRQWDPSGPPPMLAMASAEASRVIVVQTDTEECYTSPACSALLLKLQANTTQNELPYGFMVSSNGQTYEALGWHKQSPMFPQYPAAMVLAFIGNFTDTAPSQQQKDEADNFFAESISQRHLSSHYEVIGKSTAYKPVTLFRYLSKMLQWNEQESDI